MARLPQDKERIERATREAQTIIDLERQAREAKTARLREQRLSSQSSESPRTPVPKSKAGARKASNKTSDVR